MIVKLPKVTEVGTKPQALDQMPGHTFPSTVPVSLKTRALALVTHYYSSTLMIRTVHAMCI